MYDLDLAGNHLAGNGWGLPSDAPYPWTLLNGVAGRKSAYGTYFLFQDRK